jgi:predicted nuclease of predicted toxin-antitoxin system
MKFLFDQNLSYRLVAALQKHYPGSAHVRKVGLASADDRTIWQFAAAADYTIVTKDADFRQISFVYGAPPRVIWLSVGDATTAQIEQVLIARVDEIIAFHDDPQAAFLVLQ